MTADSDLLYALFVQHLGYATAAEVMSIGAEWAERRTAGATMRHVLLERRVLGPAQAELVDVLVGQAIAASSGDLAATLASLPSPMQRSLEGLTASLGPARRTGAGEHRSPTRAPPPEPVVTRTDSLETQDNVGLEAPGRYSYDTGHGGLTEELGRGGVGRVLVAKDRFLGRHIAVKELLRTFTESNDVDTVQSSTLEARFLREARVTGQLEHPAIVPVYELARRSDGSLYYSMQRVRGRTLSAAIADGRTLEGRLALLPDFITVCRAVASAHHLGVIHRDLKPQNVMLGAYGETYLMDWGLARVVGKRDPHQRTPQLAPDITSGRDIGAVGTPSYMSPEQAMGSLADIDERSDIWGLGAILFEVLTGRAPFIGKTPWEVVARVRTEAVPGVRTLAPAVAPALAAICDTAMTRDPEGRYQAAAALADDVQAWLEGERVSVYEYSFGEVARRLADRHRFWASIVAAGLVALLGSTGVTAWRVSGARNEAVAFARYNLDEVTTRLESVPGATALVDQLMQSSLEVYRQSVDLDHGPRDERLRLTRAWWRMGHLNWQLAREDEAMRAFRLAESAAQRLVQRSGDDGQALAELVKARVGLVDLLVDEGREGEALNALNALVADGDRAATLAPDDVEVLQAQSLVYSRLADLQLRLGDAQAALAAARRSVVIQRSRFSRAPTDPAVAVNLVSELTSLGDSEAKLGLDEQAHAHLGEALTQARALAARGDSAQGRTAVATAGHYLGRFEYERRRPTTARPLLLESRAALERVVQTDPADAPSLMELVEVLLLLDEAREGWVRATQLRMLGKEGEYGEAIATAAFASGHDDLLRERVTAASASAREVTLFYAAVALALAGDAAGALHLLDRLPRTGTLGVVWLDRVVAGRLIGRTGPGPLAVSHLLEDVAQRPGRAAIDATQLGHFERELSDAVTAPRPRGRLP